MAQGGAMKQSYFGRVIFPANIVQTANANYLNFVLYVDGLMRDRKDRSKRSSAKVSCSYRVRKTNIAEDPTVVKLANIHNANEGVGYLAGQAYKSVECIVEGTPVFVDSGVEKGGVYVNLESCDVKITDNYVNELYKAEVNANQPAQQPQTQPAPAAQPAQPAQPAPQATVAPTAQMQPPQAAAVSNQQAEAQKAQDTLVANSTVLSAQPATQAVEAAPVQAAPVQAAPAQPVNTPADSVKSMLEGAPPKVNL